MEMTASTITDDGNIELDIRVARPSRTNNVREIDGMGQHSKVPTPDHHPSSLDETQSESITDHASIADSAYVSKAPTSIAGASETTVQGASAEELISAQQEGQWIRGTDLYWFKEPVENPARKHYRKVGLKIGTFLTDVIRSASKDRSQKLAVNVKVIGKTKQDARARLVVFCVPEVEEVVRKEMNGSYVTDILSYHRYNIPKLDFLVIADAPTMVSKYLDVNISSNNFFTHHCDTFCGAPILLQSSRKDSNNESKQLGTFGGMIEVTYSGGTQLFGMTAGHNIEHLQKKQVVTNLGIEDSCSNAFVDLGGWICEHSIIGAVLDTSAAPAVANGIVTQSHDWALFEVKEPRPNLANHPLSEDVASHEILKAERPLFNDDLSDPVLLLGGTKGTRRGELSSLPAFICISDTLVEVFTLELHEGGVCEGDSGAWVVHSAEPALYGHVVATDAFGDAYVIPAIDTLENIRKCLGAVSVQLPTGYTRPRNERGSRGPLTPKRLWSDCFSQDRGITGNYFLAQERSSAQFLDDIDHYTDHYTDYYTAFIVNEVKRFCEGANLDEPVLKDRVIQRRNAWLDDRSVTGGSRKYHSRLTAPQLYRALRERRFEKPNLPNADRRLIYIENLDPECILALTKTASDLQFIPIRDAIWKYLASTTSIRVTVPSFAFQTFQMDFHLPYLALRPWVSPKAQPTTNKNSSFRKWTDISFLGTKQSPLHRPNEALYEAQISLCVFGIDNRKWTAYCFVDTYFNNAETVKSSDEDSGYDSEDQDEDSYVYFSEDPIASEGEHSFGLDANLPIWDPREYYLTVIRLRVGRVLQEWRLIVLVVDRRVSSYRETHFSVSLSQAPLEAVKERLDWTIKTLELLSTLLQHCTNFSQAWRKFNSQRGDLDYFRDSLTLDCMILDIEKKFQAFTDLEERLRQLNERCLQWTKILELNMNLESNRLNLQSNMSQNLGQALFRDMNQALQQQPTYLRRLVSDVIILALPFALVSSLFSIPGNDMVTKKDPQHFVLAVFCTTVVLQLTLWIAESYHRRTKTINETIFGWWRFVRRRDSPQIKLDRNSMGTMKAAYCSA